MDPKWAGASKAMVAAIISIYIGITQLVGVTLSPTELNELTGLGDKALQIITGVVALISGIVAAIARIRAGNGVPQPPLTANPQALFNPNAGKDHAKGKKK